MRSARLAILASALCAPPSRGRTVLSAVSTSRTTPCRAQAPPSSPWRCWRRHASRSSTSAPTSSQVRTERREKECVPWPWLSHSIRRCGSSTCRRMRSARVAPSRWTSGTRRRAAPLSTWCARSSRTPRSSRCASLATIWSAGRARSSCRRGSGTHERLHWRSEPLHVARLAALLSPPRHISIRSVVTLFAAWAPTRSNACSRSWLSMCILNRSYTMCLRWLLVLTVSRRMLHPRILHAHGALFHAPGKPPLTGTECICSDRGVPTAAISISCRTYEEAESRMHGSPPACWPLQPSAHTRIYDPRNLKFLVWAASAS
mmetsp:Transcript_44172/g.109780  ORF Transcript_44172/g.109780 Transcript_44172/m.109780 type:complete len:317 (-) Transcript_44172:230-1180(-)